MTLCSTLTVISLLGTVTLNCVKAWWILDSVKSVVEGQRGLGLKCQAT